MKQPKNFLPDDEMSFADLWQMLVAGWKLILGGVVAALIVAGAYLAITPSKYEVTSVVMVGRVDVAGLAQQVESVADTIGWMGTSEFMDAVVEPLGWKGGERERLFMQSFQVTSPRDRYLKIKLYGLSQDDARRAAEACVSVLVDRHRRLAEEIVTTRKRKLTQKFENLIDDIADSEIFLHRLESLGKRNDLDSSVILLQAVKNEKTRLRDLRMKENEIKESTRPELNTPTTAAEPIEISKVPVYPKTRRVWIFAAIGGLFLGVLLVSLRSIVRMNKEIRTSVDQR